MSVPQELDSSWGQDGDRLMSAKGTKLRECECVQLLRTGRSFLPTLSLSRGTALGAQRQQATHAYMEQESETARLDSNTDQNKSITATLLS